MFCSLPTSDIVNIGPLASTWFSRRTSLVDRRILNNWLLLSVDQKINTKATLLWLVRTKIMTYSSANSYFCFPHHHHHRERWMPLLFKLACWKKSASRGQFTITRFSTEDLLNVCLLKRRLPLCSIRKEAKDKYPILIIVARWDTDDYPDVWQL